MSTVSAVPLASHPSLQQHAVRTQLCKKKLGRIGNLQRPRRTYISASPTLEVYSPQSSDEQLAELYALRYQTYCLERQFLCPRDYPSGLESDAEDQRSAHFAARDTDEVVVGTSRLVLSGAGKPFPFEKHCPAFLDFTPPPATRTAEVSRLAVSKKRRNQESASQLVQAIYRQMYRYSREHGIRYWYAAMERSLARMLASCGFVFTPIGPTRDYYGPVTPYMADLDTLEQQLELTNPELLRWFRHGS